MKFRIYSILFIISVWFAAGCDFLGDFEKGNGIIISEKREVGYFSKIRIGGNFEVFLKQGDHPGIEVVTDENLHQYIDTYVNEDELVVQQEKKIISRHKLQLKITFKELSFLRVTGAAKIVSEDYIKQNELEVRMDGAGLIDLKIKTRTLNVLLSGAGSVKIAGETDEEKLRLTGAGGLNALNLESKTCDISVSGLGSAEIFVTRDLVARIEGVGGIKYAGKPENVKTEIGGIGKITEMEE